MLGDATWVTARHTLVEVRRNLARLLPERGRDAAQAQLHLDWARTAVVELDVGICDAAAELGEATGIRTLDALHLAAAEQVRDATMRFLTYDRRRAAAASALGWTVLGAAP